MRNEWLNISDDDRREIYEYKKKAESMRDGADGEEK